MNLPIPRPRAPLEDIVRQADLAFGQSKVCLGRLRRQIKTGLGIAELKRQADQIEAAAFRRDTLLRVGGLGVAAPASLGVALSASDNDIAQFASEHLLYVSGFMAIQVGMSIAPNVIAGRRSRLVGVKKQLADEEEVRKNALQKIPLLAFASLVDTEAKQAGRTLADEATLAEWEATPGIGDTAKDRFLFEGECQREALFYQQTVLTAVRLTAIALQHKDLPKGRELSWTGVELTKVTVGSARAMQTLAEESNDAVEGLTGRDLGTLRYWAGKTIGSLQAVLPATGFSNDRGLRLG